MRGKQVVAAVVAVVLIAGAWLIRTRVIDGDSADAPQAPSTASTVVCVSDLRDVCTAALAGRTDVQVRFEAANTTLEARGSDDVPSDAIWITMEPFPEMVDQLRARSGRSPAEVAVEPIGSSPLSLVVVAARAESLQIGCGDPVQWRCLGDAAGGEWSELDANAPSGKVLPAFGSHPSMAIAQLGVTNAFLGFFGSNPIDRDDPALITWVRRLARTAQATQGTTAIQTIQIRQSALNVAVGVQAELVDPDDPRFVVLPTEPALNVEVVAVVPVGTKAPDGLIDELRTAFVADGWERQSATAPETVTAADMLLVRALWEELVS
jgi:hypothetical protein